MKNLYTFILTLGFSFISYFSMAQLTRTEIQEIADEFSQIWVEHVYDGGIYIRAGVSDYSISDTEIRIHIQMSWNGNINIDNYYIDRGILIFRQDAYGHITQDYKCQYRNQTATDYLTGRNAAVGLGLAVSLLSEISK